MHLHGASTDNGKTCAIKPPIDHGGKWEAELKDDYIVLFQYACIYQ